MIFVSLRQATSTACLAEEAIELVATWPPDLAIVDVVLPKMNGIDLVLLLNDEYPACRFLLLSGQAATSDLLAAATESGHVLEIIAKPVHPSILLDVASQLGQP